MERPELRVGHDRAVVEQLPELAQDPVEVLRVAERPRERPREGGHGNVVVMARPVGTHDEWSTRGAETFRSGLP